MLVPACAGEPLNLVQTRRLILGYSPDVTFIATGLEQMLLCQLLDIEEGYAYTDWLKPLPIVQPGDLLITVGKGLRFTLYEITDKPRQLVLSRHQSPVKVKPARQHS